MKRFNYKLYFLKFVLYFTLQEIMYAIYIETFENRILQHGTRLNKFDCH